MAVPCDESVTVPPEGGKKKRKTRKQDKNYFNAEVEQAFWVFMHSKQLSATEKNKLFNTVLYPALDKLIECIMRRYHLSTPSEHEEDTKVEAMTHLYNQMWKFDFTCGKKLYSYLGTICKHFLCGKRMQDMKHTTRHIYYDRLFPDSDAERSHEATMPIDILGVCSEEAEELDSDMAIPFTTELINSMIDGLEEMLAPEFDTDLTNNERLVGEALLCLLRDWEEIFVVLGSNKFTKSAFLFFLQESTHLTLPEVREAMIRFKAIYQAVREDTLNGHIDNQPNILFKM